MVGTAYPPSQASATVGLDGVLPFPGAPVGS